MLSTSRSSFIVACTYLQLALNHPITNTVHSPHSYQLEGAASGMPSFKSTFTFLFIIALLRDETFVQNAMGFLLAVHISIIDLCNQATDRMSIFLPLVMAHLPPWSGHLAAVTQEHCKQIIVFARRVLIEGAVVVMECLGIRKHWYVGRLAGCAAVCYL